MTIDYKGKKLFYRIKGKGPAVVFLHGFTGSCVIWNDYLEELSTTHLVVAIDLPGHGQSESLSNNHSMEDMGNAVKTILDHLEISHAVIIGHSMGGYVALAIAQSFPDLIKGLGLFHSTARSDSPEAKELRERAIKLIGANHKDFLFEFIPGLFAPENRSGCALEISNLIEMAKGMTSEAIIAAQRGMMERIDFTTLLANAPFPVMFVAGHKDQRIPFESILQQIAIVPQAHSLTLRNCGHMGFIEAKETCLTFTKNFVDACYR